LILDTGITSPEYKADFRKVLRQVLNIKECPMSILPETIGVIVLLLGVLFFIYI